MKRFPVTLALILLALLLTAQPVLAQETFSFQGRLTTPDGMPVNDGSHSVRFQLYEDETGGSPRWGEAHAVTTDDGVFSVVLGTKTTLNLEVFDETPYLLLIVENEEMEPRVPLTAVPYAMKSYRLDEEALVAGQNVSITRLTDGTLQIGSTGGGGGTGGLTSVASDATLTGNGTSAAPLGLADGSVTGSKLSNNALLAGANVDIVRRGNGSLEISSTGSGGGLTQVASDATLAGNGTAGSPLGLADGALVAGTNVTITRQGSGAFEVASTGGGLAQVTSNATLTGEGTAGAPLQVSVPLVLTNPGNGTVLEAHNGTGTTGHLGGSESGAYGESSQGHRGLLGGEFSGVFGLHGNGNTGDLGSSNYGAYGFSNTAAGVYGGHNSGTIGLLGSLARGVYGEHSNGNFGYLGGAWGVSGQHSNGNFGGIGTQLYAVYGESSGIAIAGFSSPGDGVYGFSSSGNGVVGVSTSGRAVYGVNGSNWGALGTSSFGGAFNGDVIVLGNLAKSSGSFKIDHPLDPEGKYLSHSFVESPDMMNVYNGNVITDENGEAVVTLPDYFEALNRDFRYQLTVIGTFAQAIVAEEIQGNRFVIRTDQPNVKVSWLVTGIRQDAWAEEHRIIVEEDKPAKERGFYLHPKLFGQPQQRSVEWARHPEMMREIQEQPVRLEAEQRQIEQEHPR